MEIFEIGFINLLFDQFGKKAFEKISLVTYNIITYNVIDLQGKK